MNIRLLTSFFLPDSVGGGETHTLHLAKALKGRGHDVRIWRTATATASPRGLRIPGHPGRTCADRWRPRDDGRRQQRSGWRGVCASERIDVVHVTISGRCQAMMAAVAAAGVPMVVTFLDFHYWCSRALQHADGGLCPGPESVARCHQCLAEIGRARALPGAVLAAIAAGSSGRHRATAASEHAGAGCASDCAPGKRTFELLVDAGSMFIAPSPIMRRLAEQAGVAPDRIVDLPYGVPSEFVGAAREKHAVTDAEGGVFRTAGAGERRRRAAAGGHLAAAEPASRAESVRRGAAGSGRVSGPARRDSRP